MPRLKPAAITLSETERLELEKVVNRHQSPQQLALRARILLQADAGGGNREIARNLGVSREMVQLWRKRWLETAQHEGQAVKRLKDGQRTGAPAQFKMEQIIQLFAIACESPQVYGYPISHWTARELAEVLVREGIVAKISVRHVGRLLAEADLKPHQSEYWLNPPKKMPILRSKCVR